MKFALNYSHPAATLYQKQQITFDYFKVPAWPNIVAEAAEIAPTYVHFPLMVGLGNGQIIDSEEKRPTDYTRFLPLKEQTQTHYMNVHLIARAADYPHIPQNSTDHHHITEITDNFITDVKTMCGRFGAENVIVENVFDDAGTMLRIALLPEVINTVVAETGCGFLLDVAHAYLAARYLEEDAQIYTAALPVQQIRELHIAGIQTITGRWAEIFAAHTHPDHFQQRYINQPMDHLPLSETDWPFIQWALEQIHLGHWSEPWAVSLEYGGVGPLWEALTETDVLVEQLPKLTKMIAAAQPLPNVTP